MPQAITVPANIQFNASSIQHGSRQIKQALGRITGQASEFQKSLDASTARVFAFGATTAVLQSVNQTFKKLVGTTIEVEKRLIEINSIFQASASEFNKFRNSIFDVAKQTGQSFSTVADGAAELARQGLSAAETAKRLQASLILTRISGLDAESSVKALTAAINGFTSAGLTAEQIVNKIVAVDTAFAVSAQDLADGFSRAGSTAEDAGVSFDELLALITAVEQRTARGGAVIGNAFKSIFTRLSRGTTISELQALGVEIDNTQTGIQKLQALSQALERISDPSVSSKIKELAGGVFQINVVSSTLKDLASDTSIFAEAAETASSATNEAFQKNEQLGQSLSAQINELVVGLTNLGEKIGQTTLAPLLSNLTEIATKVSGFFEKAFDPEKGSKLIQGLFKTIGAFISGPGLIMITTAFLKITTLVAKFAKDGFQSIMAIGSAQERSKVIQAGIVELLHKDATLRQKLTSATLTQAQKEQAVIDAIRRENAELEIQRKLMMDITNLAMRRGVRGYTESGGFSGSKGKTYKASGFMAEEAMAMALGASSDVSAHYGQGRIGGKKFIMNNQEVEIPNFGRNGDSAVIPMYAAGKNVKEVEKIAKGPLPTIIKPTGSETSLKYNPSGEFADGNKYSFKFPVASSSQGERNALKDQFEKQYDTKTISDMFKRQAQASAKLMSDALGVEPLQPDNVDKIKDPDGFKGAIQAAYGSVFDRAMSTVFGAANNSEKGGNFDVRTTVPSKQEELLKKAFGPHAVASRGRLVGLADYKISTRDSGIKESMAFKTLRELGISPEKKPKQKAGGRGRGRNSKAAVAARLGKKARGHFPKFSKGNFPKFAKGNKTGSPASDVGRSSEGLTSKFLAMQFAISGLSAVTSEAVASKQQELEKVNEMISAEEARIKSLNLSEEETKKQIAAFKESHKERISEAKAAANTASSLGKLADMAIQASSALMTINALSGGKAGKMLSTDMLGGAKKYRRQKKSFDSFMKSGGMSGKSVKEQRRIAASKPTLGKAVKSLKIGSAALTITSATMVAKAGWEWGRNQRRQHEESKARAQMRETHRNFGESILGRTEDRAGMELGELSLSLFKKKHQLFDAGDYSGAAAVGHINDRMGSLQKEINALILAGKEIPHEMSMEWHKMSINAAKIINGDSSGYSGTSDQIDNFLRLQKVNKGLSGAEKASEKNYSALSNSLKEAQSSLDMTGRINMPSSVQPFAEPILQSSQSVIDLQDSMKEIDLLKSSAKQGTFEGNTDDYNKALAEAGEIFKGRASDAAASVQNALTQSATALTQANKRLEKSRFEDVSGRLGGIEKMSKVRFDPQSIDKTFGDVSRAETPEEKNEALLRLSELKNALDAIDPEIFPAMAKARGISAQDLKEATRGGLERSALMSGMSPEAAKIFAEERTAQEITPEAEKDANMAQAANDSAKSLKELIDTMASRDKDGVIKNQIDLATKTSELYKQAADSATSATAIFESMTETTTKAVESSIKAGEILEKSDALLISFKLEQKRMEGIVGTMGEGLDELAKDVGSLRERIAKISGGS